MRSRRSAGGSSYGAIKWPRPWPEALRTTTLPILPVEQNIPLGGDRKAERGIKGVEIVPLVGRKVDLLKLKDRVIFAIGVEVLEPFADPQRGRYKLLRRKIAGVADGEAVGVAEDPIQPLLDDLMLGQG